MGPLISVIIPVYQVEPYLCRCLDSMIGQTYRNLEIILVDDGSQDRCGDICDAYAAKDRRITVIHQENGGVAAARNAGLAIASGDWIGWVDPDDDIELDMYEYLLTHVLAHGADMAVCEMRDDASGALEQSDCKAAVLGREQVMEQYLNGTLHYGCVNKLSRRQLWAGLHFPDYRMAEDFAVMWRLAERVETAVRLYQGKYIRCRREGSITTNKGVLARLDEYQAAKECFDGLIPHWPQFEILLACRCAEAAGRLWCGCCGMTREEREQIRLRLKEISDFCRPYIPAALTRTGMGRAGRLTLRLVARPQRWALDLACFVNWIYQKRYRWPL